MKVNYNRIILHNQCQCFLCKSMYKSPALAIGAPSCAASCGLATWLRLSCGMSSTAWLPGTVSRSTIAAKSGRLWYSRFLYKSMTITDMKCKMSPLVAMISNNSWAEHTTKYAHRTNYTHCRGQYTCSLYTYTMASPLRHTTSTSTTWTVWSKDSKCTWCPAQYSRLLNPLSYSVLWASYN